MSKLLDTLRSIVGDNNVLTGDTVSARATHFWNPAPLQAMALVRPATTEEVSAIMAACHAVNQPVVTHGGITGLAEGDRSSAQDLILSLERMRNVESVDATGKTMVVQAGVVLETVQNLARESGLQFGLDIGARGSCTIGGNISTNAGGLSVLRYGMMREQVLGLEAVLADGTVVSSMNKMMKNNAGYDLKQLFIGSEGTLGIVTRAVLRLRASTPTVNTALVAFENFRQVTDTLAHMDQNLNGQLNAYEVIWQPFYQLNTNPDLEDTVTAPIAADYPIYAIIESRGNDAETDQKTFELAMESAFEQEMIVDAVIAQSESSRAAIWQIRENIEIALKHHPMFIYDISLPIVAMDDFLDEVETSIRSEWAEAVVYAYGHIADGNLHVMVAPVPSQYGKKQKGLNTTDNATNEKNQGWLSISNQIVYTPLIKLGGSVAAEHGVGLTKKPYLEFSRNPAEIALMNQLKKSMDPNSILNPGKIL